MKIYQIYGLYCPFTDQLRYIGATSMSLKRRLLYHGYRARKQNSKRDIWLRSLMPLKPIIQPIEVCDESNWEEKERYWISKFRDEGFDLVNNSGGGKGPLGAKYTKEYMPQPKEKIIKRMATMADTLNKRGKNGCNNSKGFTTEVLQYTKDGVFIAEYKTTTAASAATGVKRTAITENLRGVNKSSGGFVWKFKYLK